MLEVLQLGSRQSNFRIPTFVQNDPVILLFERSKQLQVVDKHVRQVLEPFK